MSGPPASGKTTLAVALAARLGYAIFDLDTVTAPLTRTVLRMLGAGEDTLDSTLGAQLRPARYRSLLDGAAANRALGLGVVVAAPFTREGADARAWQTVVGRLGTPTEAGQAGDVALVYLDCPPELLAARLAARRARRDASKLTDASSRPLPAAPAWADVVVDATASTGDQVEAALAALRSGGLRSGAPTDGVRDLSRKGSPPC